MGVDSGIGWTDNTFNPYWGCEKVSPACDNCYAETWATRMGFKDAWNGKYRFFGDKHWNEPLRWQKRAEKENRRIKVFCGSMCDWADIKVPGGNELRERLFKLIKATPNLDWQLLTKRIGNVKKMLPEDWGDGYPNVWLGITVVNQEEFDRDWPKLRETPAYIRWLSIEPMLENIRINKPETWHDIDDCPTFYDGCNCGPHWVVVGGESGLNVRVMKLEWARSMRDQTKAIGAAYFFKQWGEYAPRGNFGPELNVGADWKHNPDEMVRVGTKKAGNTLDGKQWMEFPNA